MSERQRNKSLVRRVVLVVVTSIATMTGRMGPARADGAFPNSQSILLPRDRPNQIILGTTFGLVFSEDNGATWRYSCEIDATIMPMGGQYVLGAPPDNRIYARSDSQVSVSLDEACTWIVGVGDIVPPLIPFDVFADPSDPLRVFVLAEDPDQGLVSAFRSVDAGRTYVGPIFKSPQGGVVTGIESARSASHQVYLTLYQGPGVHPVLAQSTDGGDTWATTDIEAGVGAVVPYLAAVDPQDSRKIYMRITSGAGVPEFFQGLAVSADAGLTWSTPLRVANGSLLGFARLPDGNLFLVGTTAPAVAGEFPQSAAFRSDDGGKTFTTLTLPFHPIGLAERNGTLFVATNNFLDGMGLVSSDDGGRSWTTRLRFQEIDGVKDCVRATCQLNCDFLAGIKLFPPEVCNPPDPPKPPKASTGCGCDFGAVGRPDHLAEIAWVLTSLGWVMGRRRRGRDRR